MDDQQQVEILEEILEERLTSLRHIINEWSVPEADALNYAQAKDLIWQMGAPLGLAMVGYSAAERVLREDPANHEMLQAQELFASSGEEIGQILDRFLAAADRVRH